MSACFWSHELGNGGRKRRAETGIVTDPGWGGVVAAAAEGTAKTLDVLDGGNAKRERTAKAQRDAARANAEAMQAQLEMMRLSASAPSVPSAAPVVQGAAGGGAMAWLTSPSPLGGLPWGGVLVVGVGLVVGAYLLASR